MNEVKNRLIALSLLDRAFRLLPDEQISSLYAALDEENQNAIQHIASVKGQNLEMPALLEAIRICVNKGRINGDLERMSLVLTNNCLTQTIEALGSNSDDPSEENLRQAIPTIIEHHGLPVTQLMLASVITGEAIASPIITRLLKHDADWKLPPASPVSVTPLPAPVADDPARIALKEQRKARKLAEQEVARRRREQIARAQNK